MSALHESGIKSHYIWRDLLENQIGHKGLFGDVITVVHAEFVRSKE